MKPLDFTMDNWNGTTWELVNPMTGFPVDLNLFRQCEAERCNYAPYESIINDCWQHYLEELDDPYAGSSVFVRYWANMYIYYLMLGEREARRLQALKKINSDTERKEVEKIQKESERLYKVFEMVYYEKLKGY